MSSLMKVFFLRCCNCWFLSADFLLFLARNDDLIFSICATNHKDSKFESDWKLKHQKMEWMRLKLGEILQKVIRYCFFKEVIFFYMHEIFVYFFIIISINNKFNYHIKEMCMALLWNSIMDVHIINKAKGH